MQEHELNIHGFLVFTENRISPILRFLFALLPDDKMYSDRVFFWDDVHGFRMSCMKPLVLSEPEVRLVSADTLITEPAVVKVSPQQQIWSLARNLFLMFSARCW